MKLYLILFTILSLSALGCSSVSKRPDFDAKYEGMCSHPAFNQGQPFNIDDTFSYDGANVTVTSTTDTSKRAILTGATCVLLLKK